MILKKLISHTKIKTIMGLIRYN